MQFGRDKWSWSVKEIVMAMYHNPHKTLVFMVLIEKQLTIKREEF